ncbi:WD repeat protein with Ser/Thr protein kinase motif [Tolypothrix sp. NIES-4075]|uniref:serine/threonine-protein kinase n=1 Tax=Tolypothrix sp. NIES-4075 TaxID=2005459 RepID=UPI000B5C35D0|nr:serine/threonine-protein kinase [Tolypothrix sp. NIES-4075]GAX43692.1 WD repeat protein with Ser/Thr protein kinase motif [Tolypothrix sp. NIES-4075]
MLCCLNPDCQDPLNPDGNKFCQYCDTPLISLLRGHYRVIKLLSDEGGFGRTYLAEDVDKLNEQCVVKQLAPKIQEASALRKAVELFKEEAKRLQQLGEHNQIPTLLAYFEQDNYLYLVQQFIDGQNLLKELQQQGTFSESKIKELLLSLLPILKFIHDRGVIHRDIKPQNIIRRQNDGQLVLIDFGASKQLSATVMMKTGTAIGSHGYTPIEQMQDGKAYPASDLFGLGATCFHLMTGIRPSQLWMEQGFSWVTSWRKYLHNSGSGITSRLKLGKVLDKLLKTDIEKRYQSADEVLSDLISVSPPSAVITTLISTQAQSLITSRSASTTLQLGARLRNQLIISAAIVVLAIAGIWYSLSRPVAITKSSPSQPVKTTSENSDQPSTLKGHSSDVNSVTFSPDGQMLVTGSDDRTIKLWNLTTKQEIRTFKGHTSYIYAIAISPDGQTIASGSVDKTIKLWNLNTGKEIRTLKGHSDSVASVAFSPDGKLLASSSLDKTIKLWNLETNKEIRTLTGHSQAVASVAFSPDGKTLASGSWDKTIKLWNLNTGKEIRTLTGHLDFVLSIAFSPDGQQLASGSKDKTIKLWNVNTPKVIRTLTGHDDKVTSVAYIPKGGYSKNPNSLIVASGSNDNTIKLWDTATGREIRTLKKDSGYVYAIAISPDGRTIASGGSADNIIKIWRP